MEKLGRKYINPKSQSPIDINLANSYATQKIIREIRHIITDKEITRTMRKLTKRHPERVKNFEQKLIRTHAIYNWLESQTLAARDTIKDMQTGLLELRSTMLEEVCKRTESCERFPATDQFRTERQFVKTFESNIPKLD